MAHTSDRYDYEKEGNHPSYKGGVPDMIPQLTEEMERHLAQAELIRQSRERFENPGDSSVADMDVPYDLA